MYLCMHVRASVFLSFTILNLTSPLHLSILALPIPYITNFEHPSILLLIASSSFHNLSVVTGFLTGTLASAYWVLPVIHGYYKQKRFSFFGRVLDLTLLARRSRHYAGTRYGCVLYHRTDLTQYYRFIVCFSLIYYFLHNIVQMLYLTQSGYSTA